MHNIFQMLQTYKIDYTSDIQTDALVLCKSLYEMPIGEQKLKRFEFQTIYKT